MADDNPASVSDITSEVAVFRALANSMVGRAATAALAGQSYGGERDLYKTLGYKAKPTFTDFYNCYNRQDVARRIVKAPVNASWRSKPTIEENLQGQPGDRTEFEKAWDNMVKDLRLYHYLVRVDRLAGIGEFGALFLGFDDGQELNQEVTSAQLVYLHPYNQGSLVIDQWDEDTTSERYGQPLQYKVTMTLPGKSAGQGMEKLVHWSRMLHVAEDPEENDVIGTPRLRAVYNRLQDLEKIAGGSAEMFWRGAFPGYALKADDDFDFTPESMDALEEEMTKFIHDLQRYFRAVGVDIKELGVQVADPAGHADILFQLISAATGIPKRILIGSERGELASTMDERNWNTHVEVRREDHCELLMIRPLITRLTNTQALPPPGEDGYTVEWEDLSSPTEKETAEVLAKRSEALSKYVSSGAEGVIPWTVFLKREMNFTDEEITQMEQALEDDALDEEVAAAEAAEVRKQIEQELRDAGWQPPQAQPPEPPPTEED